MKDRTMNLHIILLTCLLCTNIICFTLSELNERFVSRDDLTIFVSSSGFDSLDCGQKEHPCKSFKFALENVGNATSVFINVIPGVYSFESVKMDCSLGNLRNVVIQGFGESAQIGLSADILKCNVKFTNLQWRNTSNHVLINSIISNVSIINSTVSHIGFSLLSTGSSINIINSVVTECAGWQALFPLISASGVTGFNNKIKLQNSTFSYTKAPILSIKTIPLAIQNTKFISNTVGIDEVLLLLSGAQGTMIESIFTNNFGTAIKIVEESVINMTRIMFTGNNVTFGTLVHIGKGGSLRASVCSFTKSYGMSQGPVVNIGQGSGKVNFTNCNFKCNQVNGSTSLSPVKNSGKRVMTCSNCTTDHRCPVLCQRGEYLINSIMCLSCPSGTYSPGSGFNFTTFACKKCETGFYSSKEGSSTCSPCKPGSFAAKPGSTMCRVCKNNFMTSNEGQSSCSKLTTSFIVLTVCVTLLIVVPLLVLLVQYLHTKNTCIPKRQKHFHRLYENGNLSVHQHDSNPKRQPKA